MKPRVYKLAAIAFFSLAALGTPVYAQKKASSSAKSTESKAVATPAPATAPSAATSVAPATTPAPLALVVPDTDQLFSYNVPAVALEPLKGQLFTQIAPLASYNSLEALNGFEAFGIGSQDTTYQKKMKALQQQMRDLQKQMSELRTDEMKKSHEELAKRMAERKKEYDLKFKANFDKTFSEKFKNMSHNFTFRWDRSDSALSEKVKNGDVKLKTKNFSKSYPVNGDDKLAIENLYGKVTVNTWAKKEFKVDVEIKAYADDDAKAAELLDAVSINDSKDASQINFTTSIKKDDSRNSFWGTWTSNGKTSVRKVVINYTVYMPAKNPVTIKNTYGSVILPDLFGKVEVNSRYGNFVAKSLPNAENTIKLQYVDASIDNLVGADVNMQYGSLQLASADKLNGSFSYTPVKIARLNGTSTVNTRYGGLQIDNVQNNVKALQINSSYAPVKLGDVGNADFDVTVQYGGFTYDNNAVSITSQSPDDSKYYSTTKTYKGKVGKGSADKTITIRSSYAGVKFEQ